MPSRLTYSKYGASILGATFKEQTKKWEDITLSHVSDVISLVHRFIVKLIESCVPEESVRNDIWDCILTEELCAAYKQAMDHARFLLRVEREGTLVTYNHYFNNNLQRARGLRLGRELDGVAVEAQELYKRPRRVVPLDALNGFRNKANPQQVREDIHDALRSYYKVARKRFVDNVCQQAIDEFLLNGAASPLKILCPTRVAELTDSQLEMIAGEDVKTRNRRQALGDDIGRLTAAMKVLQQG